MFKKKLGFLLGVMVLLSVAGYLVCLLAGGGKKPDYDEEILVVTSFYPMYVLAENLTAGVDGIAVSNLTENQTGCLHDYQLFPEDMKLLARADAFMINGAGMELFMAKVLEHYPQLPVVEASHGIALLEGTGHHHSHGEKEQEEADHDHHSHEENGHVWMDVERYRQQANMVNVQLQGLFPNHAGQLQSAAEEYDKKLEGLSSEVAELREKAKGMPVAVFHEAFAYLAESLEMEILMELSLDEDALPSPGEIAELIEEIKYHGAALIFIEKAYASYADKILAETQAQVVYLDPLTTGDGLTDSYLTGMRSNLEAIREVTE